MGFNIEATKGTAAFLKEHGIRTWNISIYNAYNHNNPFIVYTDYKWDEATQTEKKVLMQASLFPIIPSVSYSYKF